MNYAYIRYSTDSQDERQQLNTIDNYLSDRSMSLDGFESDEGVSGGVSYRDRKLYGLILGMSRGDSLIVSEISRLGRSMSDLNKLISDELVPRGIRLIVIKMSIDLDCANIRAIDQLILNNFAFAAQLEKELIQDRTKSALEARKKSGIKIGGTKELWGKNTGSDRDFALTKARIAAAEKKKQVTMSKPENKYFKHFMQDYIESHGDIIDWEQVSKTLNSRGMKTATGLEFTSNRARAMYNKISRYD